jgi:hypothetical protein
MKLDSYGALAIKSGGLETPERGLLISKHREDARELGHLE